MNRDESTADADLLADRVRNGDPAAEYEFVELYGSRVNALVSARLQDALAAEDLTQETLLAALVAMREGRPAARHKLPSFVWAIARNLCNRHLRDRIRRRDSEWIEVEASEPDPERRFRSRELLNLAIRGASRLDVVDQRILHWSLEEDLSSDRIGSRLGIRPATVRQRKCRALRRIRAKLLN